jgi:hypothetical protein
MATSWHLTSLTVLGGTLHGKKLAIEDVVVEVLIGSDPDCHRHLDLPTVSPIHARLWIEPDDVTVYGTRSGPGVFVNFDRIEVDGKLEPGDLLWLGPPQGAGSVMLQAHFEERDSLPPVVVSPMADEELEAEAPGAPLAPAEASQPDAASPPLTFASEGFDHSHHTAEPLALEATALGEPFASTEPPSVEPVVEALATSMAETQEEALGVLPEDAPTPRQLALQSAEPIGSEPPPIFEPPGLEVPASPDPTRQTPQAASAEEPPPAFDDFLVMDSAAWAAPPPPPSSPDEFVVSGFDAKWPEDPEPPGVAAVEAQPTAETPPDPYAPAGEDVFFVEGDSQPAPVAALAESDDSFFIDDASVGSAPFAASVPIPPHVSGPGADLDDLSFANAFFEEPPSSAPLVSTPPGAPRPTVAAPPPVAKPVIAEPPPVPKPASPPAASAPPSSQTSPAVSQKVAAAALPSRSPSATSAVRPLPRPDVSQSVSRGDRPSAIRPDRTQAVRPRRPAASSTGRHAVIGAIALVVLGGIGFAVSTFMRSVRLDSVSPQRARVGDTVALVGRGFASSPGSNVVLFDEVTTNVTTATPTRLEVVVPDVATTGADVRTKVRVRVGRAESTPVEIAVYSGPVLHGISPDVAMPGEEVVLAGSGWGLGPTVRFGGLAAEVMEARETSIRVRVPPIDGGPGTAAPVIVSSGSLESNPGPFYVGRIPLVTKADPSSASPGDVVSLTGRGFRRECSQNAVQVGGVRALVVAAFDNEIKVVIPRVPAGSRMLEVRVPSSVAPAQVPLVVGGATDTLDFHFVAEPFDAVPGRDHAVLATALGPAFVLASSGGRSAAERALEAARRLNEAAQALKASHELTFDLRDADSRPTLGLVGRPERVVEVTDEDAAAYGEDWTGLRGRGGPVTAGRLARWWEAVAKDLVLLLARGERPHFAADLAPEGRALVDFFRAGGSRPAAQVKLREALRLVALRVPPGVRGPATVAPVSVASANAPVTPPSAAQPMPRLDGPWSGSENETGRQRYVTVTFRGATGTISYEGVMTVSAPLLSVEQAQRGAVRFSVELRGGLRYYVGRWDGQALTGKVSTDPGGAQSLGTFELRPR